MDPVALSKLSLDQRSQVMSLRVNRPELDIDTLVDIMANEIFDRGLKVPQLVRAVDMLGPLAVDAGKRIWRYDAGVWLPDGDAELTRRVLLCTGDRYKADYPRQAESIIKARTPKIQGLGPSHLINVKNGMLNWSTLEVLPHDAKYYSTYQVTVPWNPQATCPTVEHWFAETFDERLHNLLWQVIGVTIYPGMGFQKIIALVGSGYNGKGTLQRLCMGLLPESAYTGIDPRELVNNRFKPAELFGKTANICGDIERFTFNSTAELKKITGDDPINAERKMGHPFTFVNQATILIAANKMPQSRDTSDGWFRRWHIVPLERKISGRPDRSLEPRMKEEREGVLVKAVLALRQAMEQGGFDEPEESKRALREYQHACNSIALFVNERITFGAHLKAPVSRKVVYSAYKEFCRDERLEIESRQRFYESLEDMGAPYITDHWTTRDDRDRGYVGLHCEGVFDPTSF
ncbi:MAG: phage/plasmid primase, P4 family [Actinomycetes bacterium]